MKNQNDVIACLLTAIELHLHVYVDGVETGGRPIDPLLFKRGANELPKAFTVSGEGGESITLSELCERFARGEQVPREVAAQAYLATRRLAARVTGTQVDWSN